MNYKWRIAVLIYFFLCHFEIGKPINYFLDGCIIKDNDEMEAVQIRVPININGAISFPDLMFNIKIKDKNGANRKYNAGDLHGFRFSYNGKVFKFYSFCNDKNIDIPFAKYVFLHLVEEGDINLYRYYFVEGALGIIVYGSKFYISTATVPISSVKEKSEFLNFIVDEPELCKEVEKSSVFLEDISFLIKKYNKHRKEIKKELPSDTEE